MDTLIPDKIEFEAANSLVSWKNQFAQMVKTKAAETASADGVKTVTWQHYHEAAAQAIIEMSEVIKSEQNPNERREAA